MQYKLFFLTRKPKNRKYWIFLCLLCVHSKFFVRQFVDVILFPKNFSWCFDTFWVSKKFAKNSFFWKKGYTAEISGEKKTQNNLEIFFFGKMKKSEKNNAEKCAIFLTKNPKLGKPKNRNFWIFLCLLCVHSKKNLRQLFDVMLFPKKVFVMFRHPLGI